MSVFFCLLRGCFFGGFLTSKIGAIVRTRLRGNEALTPFALDRNAFSSLFFLTLSLPGVCVFFLRLI